MIDINTFQQRKNGTQQTAEQLIERINATLESAPRDAQFKPVLAILSERGVVVTLKRALGYPEDEFLKPRELMLHLVNAYNAGQ